MVRYVQILRQRLGQVRDGTLADQFKHPLRDAFGGLAHSLDDHYRQVLAPLSVYDPRSPSLHRTNA